MKRGCYGYSIAFMAILSLALGSCMRMGESAIKMPANPVLTGGLGWGVVKDAYVRLKEGPTPNAHDIDHLRRGGVYALDARILGPTENTSANAADKTPTIWYGITSEGSKGWVRGTELEVYASKEQADKAASGYH
jgi:hypothetical protein